MLIDLGRFGSEATRNEYELSKTANRKYHPLERIEMDEDKLDIMLLLQKTRLWNVLHEDVQKRVELLKDRFWASVAIDCGTRSILALRLLDRDPNGRSGVATLHMAVMPKDNIAEAAGTENSWIQFGIPQEVATDHGAAYLDDEFHESVLNLCGSHLMPPTGNPKLRGRIERFFKTGKKWLRLFTGQTFSNPLVRGNYDSNANASMDFEEFARCLVRLIVDVYHVTPHRGLGGQKPIDAWATMTQSRPVDTLTDPEREGLIFGFRAGVRKISRSGVVCLGIPYYSDLVQHLYSEFKNQEIVIKANPYNLGLLGFRSVGDDAFHWVKAAVKGFDGVSAIEWVATKRLLNESYSQHNIEDEAVINKALTQIVSTAKFSEDKLKVSRHVVTKDDYDYFEKEFFAGYVAGNRAMPDYAPNPEHFLIDGISSSYEAEMSDEETPQRGRNAAQVDHGDDDDDLVADVIGPSEGTFDPSDFARRRAEDGVTAPLSAPRPPKPTKPRKNKEKPTREVTVSDLVRGGTPELLPSRPDDKPRTAGRARTFKSDWDDEEN
jgi:putative transposase